MLDAQVVQYGIYGSNMCVNIIDPGIDHVHQQVGLSQFLQSGSEGTDQLLGQISDKTDCVREDDFPVIWESESATCRIERFKDPVLGRDTTLCKYVQECRFSGIGVTDQ